MTFSTLRPRDPRRISKGEREDAIRAARASETASRRFEPAVKTSLNTFFALLAAEIGSATFISRLAEGDVDGAAESLSMATARQQLVDSFAETYAASVKASGDVAADFSIVEYDLGFDVRAAATQRHIETEVAELVTRVTDSTKQSIRESIERSVDRGVNPRRAAKQLEDLVPLLPKHSVAVDNFRDRLRDSGLKWETVDERAAKYARRLKKYRTEMIARTEMLDAAGQGTYDYWRQLADQGAINRDTVAIEWITTDDDRTCEQCAPMDGDIVGFEEKFTSDTLGLPGAELLPRKGDPILTDRPPLHPMCRCVLALVT